MQRRQKAGSKRKFDKTAERTKAFTPPDWVGKAPPGLHLDVHKSEKLIEVGDTDYLQTMSGYQQGPGV